MQRMLLQKKFQFHKGTIRTQLLKWRVVLLPDFNSIKVRLEQNWCSLLRWWWLYFNSIKVRLELISRNISSHISTNFNSIKVRLERNKLLLPLNIVLNFNSIKVRLEPHSLNAAKGSIPIFQFHKGTIRTLSRRISCMPMPISIP